MSKAIAGAALIAGVIGAEALTAVFDPALSVNPMFQKAMFALGSMGVSMEAGAIAQALTSNRGMEITTRQAAACRQIIYGQQRVGGVVVYQNTTGSSHDQYNYVIVVAGHEVHSFQNLYLDGRQVHWLGSGAGYSVRNGVGFGGIADNGTHTGPNGVQYNFGGTGHSGIYCEARYGDQSPGDVMGSLTANDPNWAADGAGNSPWLGGCAYIYLKIENNTNVFPEPPEIRITVNGKNTIYDPRTGTTGYTSNWALIAADVITDPVFGLGDNTVNQYQLISAANVCDEQVALAVSPGTLTEARYTTNHHYDTSTAPVDVLQTMMAGAAGRISRVGGEWYLWPAYWQGPSFTFDESDLTATMQWKPYKSRRDLYNRVNGTYTAPTYPYNVTGNLYDQNGFYNGMAQNNFPFAFQPTNYPQYAADVLHGYASDQYLNEDGGKQLPMELGLPTVMSVSQAQRVAKINLLRNRQQGSGTFEMGLGAFSMQPTDVMNFTFAHNGWAAKPLEVTGIAFHVAEDNDGVSNIRCNVSVVETDISVYEWVPSAEELTVYDQPANTGQINYVPAPPTSMTLTSGAGTAVVNADGSIMPRIEVQWNTPLDVLVKQIQIQYQAVGASVWLSSPSADVSLNLAFISGVIAGEAYNVRIRSLRASGATSEWVVISGYTVSITLPATYSLIPLEPGILIAEAPTASTADILVPPFVAKVGTAAVLCLPAGDYFITGLAQATLYYVYYIDPTFAGGAITPIATTNTADFLGMAGYYLIDVVRTPTFVAGSGNFSPFNFNELGNSSTLNYAYASDGNLSTAATVTSKTPISGGAAGTMGEGQWLGFANTALSYDTTLKVTAAITSIDNAPCSIIAVVNGVSTALVSSTVSVASTTYSVAVPRNTNLSTISVTVTSNGAGAVASSTASPVTVTVSEIYIPYVGTGIPGSDSTYLQPIAYAGAGESIVPNGNFILGDLQGWHLGNAPVVFGADGRGLPFTNRALMNAGNTDGFVSPSFQVVPGQKYRITYTVYNGAGSGGIYLRIIYGTDYAPNILSSGAYADFMGEGSVTSDPVPYSYDWLCPANINFASLAMYDIRTSNLAVQSVSVVPYAGVGQWGADVTGSNTALDTVYVNGVLATNISPIAGLMPIETGADKTLNHVLVTTVDESIGVQLGFGNPTAYTFLQFTVHANDPSDVFSIQAILQWSTRFTTDALIIGAPSILGYVDTPAVIGTGPNYGGAQPSTSIYQTFGFGVAAQSAHSYVFPGGSDAGPLAIATFFGSVTGLSAGSHTLALIVLDYTSGGSELIYCHAELTQVSS